MSKKKLYLWDHLDRLRKYTETSGSEHQLRHLPDTIQHLQLSRAWWKACKKRSAEIRRQFLLDHAALLASKLRTSEEKSTEAIIKAEETRSIYKNIREIMGKQKFPLTQVDVMPDGGAPSDPLVTLHQKSSIEAAILQCNHRHSLQALVTPFIQDPFLHNAIDPTTNSP
jgi:hypothetical protein